MAIIGVLLLNLQIMLSFLRDYFYITCQIRGSKLLELVCFLYVFAVNSTLFRKMQKVPQCLIIYILSGHPFLLPFPLSIHKQTKNGIYFIFVTFTRLVLPFFSIKITKEWTAISICSLYDQFIFFLGFHIGCLKKICMKGFLLLLSSGFQSHFIYYCLYVHN